MKRVFLLLFVYLPFLTSINAQNSGTIAYLLNGGGGSSGNTGIQTYTVYYTPRTSVPTARIHVAPFNYRRDPSIGRHEVTYSGSKSKKKTKTKLKKKVGDKAKKISVKKLLDKLMKTTGKIKGGWFIDIIWPVEIDSGGCIENPDHIDNPTCSEQRKHIMKNNLIQEIKIDDIPAKDILEFLVSEKKVTYEIDEFEYIEEDKSYSAKFKVVSSNLSQLKKRKKGIVNGYRDKNTGAWFIEN